jgi:hypothetical protein
MKTTSLKKKPDKYLFGILLFYSALGIMLFPLYRYNLTADAISYISIAKKYAMGNFSDAINGYWGPLFSWLLTPFILLGADPLPASRILNLLIGLPVFPVMSALSRQFSLSDKTRKVILATLVPVVLSFALFIIGPDLLVAVLLLIYFCIVFRPNYGNTGRLGLLCGLCGGISFLAKSYALPFFLSHFILMNFLHYFRYKTRREKSTTIKGLFCGLFMFVLVSGPWIILISVKYQEFTFSTSGTYNIAVFGPETKGHPPNVNKGFYAPPNPTAICITEDRYSIYADPWSPFDSRDDFKYHITHNVKTNPNTLIRIFKRFSTFSTMICIAFMLILIQKPREILAQYKVLYPLVSLLLYVAGYVFVYICPRYIWVTCFLLLLMGGYIIELLLRGDFFTRTGTIALYILFGLSFILAPINANLIPYINFNREIYQTSHKFRPYIQPGDAIASNKQYKDSYRLAYHLDGRFYGIPRENCPKRELESELNKYQIQHFLVWDEATEIKLPLSNYRKIKINGVKEPILYSLNRQ